MNLDKAEARARNAVEEIAEMLNVSTTRVAAYIARLYGLDVDDKFVGKWSDFEVVEPGDAQGRVVEGANGSRAIVDEQGRVLEIHTADGLRVYGSDFETRNEEGS